MSFTSSEEAILRSMLRINRPATANEIARYAKLSRNTVDKYLFQLEMRMIVKHIDRDGRRYWKIADIMDVLW